MTGAFGPWDAWMRARNCFDNVPPIIVATKYPVLSWRLIASIVAKLPDLASTLGHMPHRRTDDKQQARRRPANQTRAFSASTMEFENMPKDVIRSCTRPRCNPGRLFEWQVTAMRAGGGY